MIYLREFCTTWWRKAWNAQLRLVGLVVTLSACVQPCFFFQVKQLLKEGGASREFYYSELVTHVISDGSISTSTDGIPEDFNRHTVVHVSSLVSQPFPCLHALKGKVKSSFQYLRLFKNFRWGILIQK